MKTKFRTLTDRQMLKAKCSSAMAALFTAAYLAKPFLMPDVQAQEDLMYNEETYTATETAELTHGTITYFSTNVVVCNRYVPMNSN